MLAPGFSAPNSEPIEGSGDADKVIVADLQHEECGRGTPRIGDEVGASGWHRIGLTGMEQNLLFGLASEQPYRAGDDVEGILNFVVVVPGHDLRRTDLHFGDANA